MTKTKAYIGGFSSNSVILLVLTAFSSSNMTLHVYVWGESDAPALEKPAWAATVSNWLLAMAWQEDPVQAHKHSGCVFWHTTYMWDRFAFKDEISINM